MDLRFPALEPHQDFHVVRPANVYEFREDILCERPRVQLEPALGVPKGEAGEDSSDEVEDAAHYAAGGMVCDI